MKAKIIFSWLSTLFLGVGVLFFFIFDEKVYAFFIVLMSLSMRLDYIAILILERDN